MGCLFPGTRGGFEYESEAGVDAAGVWDASGLLVVQSTELLELLEASDLGAVREAGRGSGMLESDMRTLLRSLNCVL